MIELLWSPSGRNGHGTLTVMDDERALAVDKINIGSHSDRAEFIRRLMEKNPSLDSMDVEDELLRIASEATSPSKNPSIKKRLLTRIRG